MIYGQSMGAKIGIELYQQLLEKTNYCRILFFDGAPCTKLPWLNRKVMYPIFKTFLNRMKNKRLEEVLRSKMIKKFLEETMKVFDQ